MDLRHFDFARQLLYQRTSIHLGDGKKYLVATRLAPVARQAGFDTVDALLSQLQVRPDEHLERQVLEALTTNETSFFRDQAPFETLQNHIFPCLADLRRPGSTIRIWCAACASGQEAYSVAMCWLESALPKSHQVRILATDLHREMVARTQLGAYRDSETHRGLPRQRRERFFEARDEAWVARPQLRQLIEARELNLAADWGSLPRQDIVLMRNVLVYFDLPTKQSVLGQLKQHMQPDAFLMLGGAETTLMLDNGFQRHAALGSSYYRLA